MLTYADACSRVLTGKAAKKALHWRQKQGYVDAELVSESALLDLFLLADCDVFIGALYVCVYIYCVCVCVCVCVRACVRECVTWQQLGENVRNTHVFFVQSTNDVC